MPDKISLMLGPSAQQGRIPTLGMSYETKKPVFEVSFC